MRKREKEEERKRRERERKLVEGRSCLKRDSSAQRSSQRFYVLGIGEIAPPLLFSCCLSIPAWVKKFDPSGVCL